MYIYICIYIYAGIANVVSAPLVGYTVEKYPRLQASLVTLVTCFSLVISLVSVVTCFSLVMLLF